MTPMDGGAQPGGAADVVPHGANAAGIFLHAGWRSCGSWMWERLRENGSVRGFYEPLHEELARLKPGDVGTLRPDSWRSGHSAGAPYFAEFAPMLAPRGGVRGYTTRFAFDRFFAGPDSSDAALEAYLRGLIASAAAEDRLPVMKFCRSLGRVPWLEARFPTMLHAVVLRDPEAQWRSARRQMEHDGNRYFVLAPFVILARNAEHALLADAMARLGVRVPPRLSDNLGITVDACWRHVQRLSWQERYRGFMALWIATGIAALAGNAILIDADLLAPEPGHRDWAERTIRQRTGMTVSLMPDHGPEANPIGNAEERLDASRAKAEAALFLRAHEGLLEPGRAAVLAAKLAPGQAQAAPAAPAGLRQAGLLAQVDAAAYVALARATYPLRRAHYHVRRWMARI